MKDTILCLCSPDIDRLNARRAIASVKSTDLSRAELYVLDNAFDPSFNHSMVMNDILAHGARTGRSVVILDDDVEIYRHDWLDRLHEAGADLDADIVGCVHTDDHGEINHMGEVVCADGFTESISDFTYDPAYVTNRATCVPTLCSAIVLVRHCDRYRTDVGFHKYKQDLDLCMQAWMQGRRVGLALDLRLTHNRGFTGERSPRFAQLLAEDSVRFARKWVPSLDRLYDIPELRQYRRLGAETSWRRVFMKAARYREVDAAEAIALYRQIVTDCFDPELVVAAHFHLYSLTGDVQHLVACNSINPCHVAARQRLEAAGLEAAHRCEHALDCRGCRLASRRSR